MLDSSSGLRARAILFSIAFALLAPQPRAAAAQLCGNGIVESPEACDDDNLIDGDGCDSNCTVTACGNGILTAGEQCDDGGESAACNTDCTPAACGDGKLNASAGEACDDAGESATCNIDCSAAVCGDGMLNATASEECDPPDGVACNVDCMFSCGNGVIDGAEECDDGNDLAGDGCHNCLVEPEELVCFQGENAFPSRGAKKVAFQSTADFTGTNADGNQEIFVFERRLFAKFVGKGFDRLSARNMATTQLTDTTSITPTVDNLNEQPTLNGSGKFVAYVSNANPLGSNADGNKEIFRGRLLVFDSPGNLVPDRCVGGDNDLKLCANDGDCPGLICGDPSVCPSAPARCGNVSLNREVFEWLRKAGNDGLQLRQLTDADEGVSTIGRSANFFTRAVVFSSTADLLGIKPPASGASREIFRISKKTESLVQLTQFSESDFVGESPSQGKKRFVALASDADLEPGSNSDGNVEIFLWDDKAAPGSEFIQITHTVACTNARPSVDAATRFVGFQSTCDLPGSDPNPGQTVFVFDRKQNRFPVALRGPGDTDASRPFVSRRARVITFEVDPGGVLPKIVCLFNVRKDILEGAL